MIVWIRAVPGFAFPFSRNLAVHFARLLQGTITETIDSTSAIEEGEGRMLHEILLALSGRESPLFSLPESETGNLNEEKKSPLQTYLAPAEQALIRSLVRDLGQKNKDIRTSASIISSSHASMVCRAVSTATISVHLADFQRRILEVERDILAKKSNIVGAYNIVPLSAMVGAFDGWGRKLDWLWNLMCLIQAHEGTMDGKSNRTNENEHSCTAAEIISHLRRSVHTGYADLEAMARDLVKVAETTWLRQLSSWIFHGRYPVNGDTDFFITRRKIEQSNLLDVYDIEDSLVPTFVSKATAQSILFIGKSLNHIRNRQSDSDDSSTTLAPELTLLSNHLAHLSSLEYPLNPSSFSTAIRAIRVSLSQNALQKLLSMTKVLEVLHVLKDFFLLTRGEFAMALLTAADDRLTSISKAQRSNAGIGNDLASMTIRDGEVANVLARTWAALASLQSLNDENMDEELDYARELITLSIKSMEASNERSSEPHGRAVAASFDNLLLPSPTVLSLRVTSPLDLFLTSPDLNTYSCIHAYLLAIRRAHLRLSKLLTLSVIRRQRRSSKNSSSRNQNNKFIAGTTSKDTSSQRARSMRPIWASIGSAVLFLTEVGEYFQGEVIQSSWSKFYSWLVPSVVQDTTRSASSNLSSSSSFDLAARSRRFRPTSPHIGPDPTTNCSRDPEIMTQAHKSYLSSLRTALLLDELEFTNRLRRFMTLIDHLSALMHRLDAIQQSSNMGFPGNGQGSVASHYAAEEFTVMEDLKISHSIMAKDVQGLIENLRAIDSARASKNRYRMPAVPIAQDDFSPWIGGVDRLLLKLEFGKVDSMALPQ